MPLVIVQHLIDERKLKPLNKFMIVNIIIHHRELYDRKHNYKDFGGCAVNFRVQILHINMTSVITKIEQYQN